MRLLPSVLSLLCLSAPISLAQMKAEPAPEKPATPAERAAGEKQVDQALSLIHI